MADREEAGERCEELMGRQLGPTVMLALANSEVTEICQSQSRRRLRPAHYPLAREARQPIHLDAYRAEMFLNAVASGVGATSSVDRPCLEAEMPIGRFRGRRLQGFIPPVTATLALVIRKPPEVIYALDGYIASDILSAIQCGALRAGVGARRTVLVVGGTNSGQTRLANGLLRQVAERFSREHVVILEDTVELQCACDDVLALRTTKNVTLADLARGTMRASPNRIIVGEVRGARALELLDAWATGHPGGVATLHAMFAGARCSDSTASR